MVDSGLDVGETQVLGYMKTSKRRQHGQRFGSEKDVLAIMYAGEQAVIVKEKHGIFELHGKPSNDENDIEKLFAGANELHTSKEMKVKIIRKKNKKG
ncbi:MAG TPA: hypothetical protein ENH26_01715 [Candidatus Wolfebacteria bacterium]|nr:hypothetical protein [Candidatus Wolfebacteria bacterium]